MQTYARLSNGIVAEILEIPDGAQIASMFHADIVTSCIAVSGDVAASIEPGWLFDGEHFAAPEIAAGPDNLPSITARQLRLWLLSQGRALSDVDGAIATLPAEQREPARVEWEYSTAYERTHPLIESIGDALGFTDAEIDEGFPEAAAL